MDQFVQEYDVRSSISRPRGRPKGTGNREPRDLERIIFILRRRKRRDSFAEIGRELGITRSGTRLLAKRWENDPTVKSILMRYPE